MWTSRHKGIHWRLAPAILTATAILLAACGSSGDSAETDGASASDADLMIVRYQDNGPSLSQIPIYLAAALGYFEEEGVEVRFNAPLQSSSTIAQSLLTGDADISNAGPIAVVGIQSQGQDIVGIGSIVNVVANHILLTRDSLAALEAEGVTVDSPIDEKVQALRGLTIATGPAGTLAQDVLYNVLEEFGLDPESDVTIRPLPDPTAIVAAIREGQVDASVGSGTYVLPSVADGSGQLFIDYASDMGGHSDLVQMPFLALSSTRSFVDSNPDAVAAFLRAVSRAMNDVRVGLSETQLTTLKDEYYAETDPDMFTLAYETTVPAIAESLVPPAASLENLVAAHNATSESPFDGDISQVFDTTIAGQIAEDA